MTEDALRQMVREAVAKRLGRSDDAIQVPAQLLHASHYRYLLAPAGDGACIIEPKVPCNHCGYCESHGH
jgi:hypothetical protein